MSGAGIDTSFYPKSTATNPLEMMGRMQGLQQSVLQNRLLGQEVGAKEALGRAVTANTNAQTGETNWGGALGALSQDRQGAFGVPAFAGQVLDRQIKELQQKREQLGLSTEQGKFISNGLTPFIAKFSTPDPATGKAPVPTDKDFANSITDIIVAMGPNADPNVIARAATLLQNTKPENMVEAARSLALMGDPSPDRVAQMMGTVDKTDTGSGVAITQTPTLGGPTTVRTVIDKGLSPETENTAAYVYTDPATNQQHIVTKREAANAAPGATPAGITSGVPLGTPEETARFVAQADQLRQAGDKAPTNLAALKNIRDAATQFQPGPKTGWFYQLNALRTQLGLGSSKVESETAAQEEYNKLATQFIGNQISQLGGTGTDAKLESAAKGSPSEFMSKEGIKGVTALMMGNEDAIAAKSAAWQKWRDAGNSPASYGKFQTQFNSVYNPRVFQSVYMSPQQRSVMQSNMTPKEREKFQADWVKAKRYGWIQ